MTSTTPPAARASALAARHHHLLTRDQLRGIDVTDKQIHDWQRAAFLTRVEHTVFLCSGGQLDWPTRLLACCLSADGIASHRSAASLHGIDGGNRGRPELTIPDGQSFRRHGVRVHESGDLHLIVPVVKDGIPTTPVARTVLDIGAVNRWATEGAARDAVAQRLTTWQELFATLVRHSRKGRRGCGPLRLVLDEHYGDRSESRLEMRLQRIIKLAGLPAPDQQIDVYDVRGFIMRLDFGYADRKIAIEADSVAHHATDMAFEADREKRNRLVLAGWLVLAFTSLQMRMHPTGVAEQLAWSIRERDALASAVNPVPSRHTSDGRSLT